jgi:electron transport complex protein RnfC
VDREHRHRVHDAPRRRKCCGARRATSTPEPPQDILQAVCDTGMVGLGGAAFPTHAKLTVPKQAKVHTLVVNGCECEPYLTCDHRVMVERAPDLMAGIRYAMRATGAVRAIVGVEDNKPDAVALRQAAMPPWGDIFVEKVPTKYPQGSEKMLITALFGVEVPVGQAAAVARHGGEQRRHAGRAGRLLPPGRG